MNKVMDTCKKCGKARYVSPYQLKRITYTGLCSQCSRDTFSSLGGKKKKHFTQQSKQRQVEGARKGGQSLVGRETDLSQYFNNRINKTDKCWLWTGAFTNMGYGRIAINSTRLLAHRVSWQLFKGAIPENMEICHKCDNPACVNPEHLFLGTHKDNMLDMVTKKRARFFGKQIDNS